MKLRAILVSLLLSAVPAYADTVYMLDGTTREGTIEYHDARELHLHVERGGITGTVVIPMTQISRAIIERRPQLPTASAPAPPEAAPEAALAAPQIRPPTDNELTVYAARLFPLELVASATGHGLDDMARLPMGIRQLWDRAAEADLAGHRLETLNALRDLETAAQEIPDGIERLNLVSRRQRNESFGMWMGRTHWDVISDKYASGQFDLTDVRDVERPTLIGYLKEKTDPALEPLRSYFPPTDKYTGLPGAFKSAQLQGISASNAMDIRDKATLAAAVLLAQINLEPTMPAVDKGLLYNELTVVNRIRTRAADLEPLAKAAAERAERDRHAADEKARRDAAIQAHSAGAAPR